VPGQFLLRLGALALGALTPATLPIRVPVSAVAANEASAVALTDDDVRLMDGTGFPLGRFARTGEPAQGGPRRRARRGTGFAAAGVLADDDFNDPHDPDSEIEDPENILVDDAAPARRRARAVPPASGVAFGVGGSVVWVGRDDGLWRLSLEGGGVERAALPAAGPVRQVAASADGRVVVAALDGVVVRSDDGGTRFGRLPDPPVAGSRLVLTGAGHAYLLAGGGLFRLEESGPAIEVISHDAEDATACGSVALAVVARRVIVVSAAGPSPGDGPGEHQAGDDERREVPAGAHRLACSPDGTTWVAYGAALWISADRGRTWTARDDLGATSPVAAVAVTPGALWVASGAGLAVLPLHASSPSPSLPPAKATSGASAPAVFPTGADPLPVARWRWWMFALPRVDLDFATARSSTRREVRAFVLFSFTFDPRRDTRAERRLAADARTAERREAAQRGLARSAAGRDPDPIAAEERDAVARLLD